MKIDTFRSVRKLQSAAQEIRSLAYLIGLQKFDQAPPLDIEERYEGLGNILDHLGKRILKIANELEEAQLDKMNTKENICRSKK